VSAGPADSSASSTGPRHNPWRFDSADRERLTAEGRWEQCRDELLAMAERRNEATDGSLLMNAEYLVVIGRRAG
jgi:hypothetical protein